MPTPCLQTLPIEDLRAVSGGVAGAGTLPKQPEDNRTWIERLPRGNPTIDPKMERKPPNPNMDPGILRPRPTPRTRQDV